MKKFFYFLMASLLMVGCGKGTASAPKKAQFPIWQTDEALVDQLGDETEISGVFLRPPSGYAKTTARQAGSKFTGWKGPKRLDGTSGMIQITATKVPERWDFSDPESKKLVGVNLNEALHKFIGAIKYRRTNWTESEMTAGEIDGIKFLKKTWSGSEKRSGAEMHGIMYVGVVGDRLIQLATQDVAPYHEHALKLGEAALLTFKAEGNPSQKGSSNESGKTNTPSSEPSAQVEVSIDANEFEFEGLSFKLPKRFESLELPRPEGMPKEIKQAYWRDIKDDSTPNTILIAASFPDEDLFQNPRTKLVNYLAGATDSMGVKILTKGQTQSLKNKGASLSGFGFTGSNAAEKTVSGSVFGVTHRGRFVTFFALIFDGDHEKTNAEIAQHLATLKEAK